jgi:hypothetical protein
MTRIFILFQVYLLMGIYLVLGVLAILIIGIFLDHVDHQTSIREKDGKRQRCSPALLVATFRHLRHPNQILIIPLTIYSGLEQGFMSSDFTKVGVSPFIIPATKLWNAQLVKSQTFLNGMGFS